MTDRFRVHFKLGSLATRLKQFDGPIVDSQMIINFTQFEISKSLLWVYLKDFPVGIKSLLHLATVIMLSRRLQQSFDLSIHFSFGSAAR